MNIRFTQFFSLLLLAALLGCGENSSEQAAYTGQEMVESTDRHSYARPEEARITHLDLQLEVSFENRQLKGFARYDIVQAEGADSLILDVRHLDIQRVTAGTEQQERELAYAVSDPQEYIGSALRIDIEPEDRVVTVYYQTDPEGAEALDWLVPQQTADEEAPFLYTQGQAILTRTWIPIQDSPGIRITYDAQVQVPYGLLAVMSASNPQEVNPDGRYSFAMEQPIPPYLLALAVGKLEFAPISERTGVYAEPSVVEDAVYEFADLDDMLAAAENLYGPYLWDRYDIIVLPPSFPFGGMENPRLTFATPTIIAGDRSLTALVAHELAHSWSGNLVTNATWDDFWLNEGFTVYFERRIMEALYGKSYANMLAQLGYQDLMADVEDIGPESEDTHLKLDLEGRDPDEGMTDIAYEKGAFFLAMLEGKVGRENFDAFLREYFDKHRFETLTTEEFIQYLEKNLLEKYNVEANVDDWIYGPGLPENLPVPTSERFAAVDQAAAKFKAGTAPGKLATEEWTTHEWLHFLRQLPDGLSDERMVALDDAFGFSQSGNSEILAAWFKRAIYNGYNQRIMEKIEAFLVKVGRRKFLAPLYRAFVESEQRAAALEIYEKARPNYHAVSRNTIDEILGWKSYEG